MINETRENNLTSDAVVEQKQENVQHHRTGNGWSVFLVTLVVGLIAGAVLEFKVGLLPEALTAEPPVVDYAETKTLDYEEPLSKMIAKAVEVSSKSVVSITAKTSYNKNFGYPFFSGNREESHLGSGVVYAVSKSIAYILTNNHVINNASAISVNHDDQFFKAKLVGVDQATDLAILKIDTGSYRMQAAQIADSDMLKPGYIVVAIGQPYGFQNTATMGIVSALGRGEIFRSGGYADFIQTSAQINPGNSGGPLVDLMGRVVGINTSIYSQNGGNVGIGFAIPSKLARKVADDLIQFGYVRRTELGVKIRELSPAEKMQLGKGILVGEIVPGSPAENAGLKINDILRKVDGEVVENDVWLKTKIAHYQPGDTVKITVLRKGKEIELKIVLVEKK